MGCQQVFVWKAYAKVQSRLGNWHRPRLKTSSTTIIDSMKDGKIAGLTDELRYFAFLHVPGCLFWLFRFLDSWLPSLCCSESEDSIDIELNSENSVQLRLCFFFFSYSHFSSRLDVASFNCVQVQTLPTARVTPARTDSFSWGYDHRTHACKARPLTNSWMDLLECHCDRHCHCRNIRANF